MRLREGVHYQADDFAKKYTCLQCNQEFPYKYGCVCRKQGKKYGTDQLMRLWAWNNFKRHLQSCHKTKEADEC